MKDFVNNPQIGNATNEVCKKKCSVGVVYFPGLLRNIANNLPTPHGNYSVGYVP